MRPTAIPDAAAEPVPGSVGGVALGPLEEIGVWMSGYPDSGALRFFHRLPLALWRLGLGAVLGSGFMLLTTAGARTGLPRTSGQSAHRVDGRLYAWCPYGGRAAWFKNLLAHPVVTVQTARGSWPATAVRLEEEQEARRLYRHLREFDARMLGQYLAGEGVPDSETAFAAARRRLHVVRLDPAEGTGPEALSRDLVWVWPALAAAALALLFLRRR